MPTTSWPGAGGLLPSFLTDPFWAPAQPVAQPVAQPAATVAPVYAPDAYAQAVPVVPAYPAYPAYPDPAAMVAALNQQIATLRAQLEQLLATPAPVAPQPPARPPARPPAQPPARPSKPPEPAKPPKPKNPLDGKGPTAKQGAHGAPVRQLERRLAKLGFDPGKVDGTFDAATTRAVKAFQRARGLAVDGIVGERTWKHLDVKATGSVRYPSAGIPRAKLNKGLKNAHWMEPTGCFRYAWSLVSIAAGRTIGGARQSHEGRGKGTSYLATLTANGTIKPGDIVYVNKKPGADPTSTILSYKPHWFVYMGNGQYADQYGLKASAAAMDAFVPGRYIDTIYHNA